MKERPILFSGPMIRAILEGRKTQTRRIVNPQPLSRGADENRGVDGDLMFTLDGLVKLRTSRGRNSGAAGIMNETPYQCPYGKPGDRLWVRETWSWVGPGHSTRDLEFLRGEGPIDLIYRADGSENDRWTPSIHMPRWASRLTLEIVSVRVERLQDISIDDAIAEGVFQGFDPPDGHGFRSEARNLYRELWNSINGPGSWDANPWVWVIEFKQVQP